MPVLCSAAWRKEKAFCFTIVLLLEILWLAIFVELWRKVISCKHETHCTDNLLSLLSSGLDDNLLSAAEFKAAIKITLVSQGGRIAAALSSSRLLTAVKIYVFLEITKSPYLKIFLFCQSFTEVVYARTAKNTLQARTWLAWLCKQAPLNCSRRPTCWTICGPEFFQCCTEKWCMLESIGPVLH